MKLDSVTRNIVILVVLIFSLSIGLVLWLLYGGTGGSDSDDQYTNLPQSGREVNVNERRDTNPSQNNNEQTTSPVTVVNPVEVEEEIETLLQTDWREEVVTYDTGSVPVNPNASVSQTGASEQIDFMEVNTVGDLFPDGYLPSGTPIDPNQPIWSTATNEQEVLLEMEQRIESAMLFSPPKNIFESYPVLANSSYDYCGTMPLPSANFPLDEDEDVDEIDYTTANCMGKAIADGCEPVESTLFLSSDVKGIIRIVERDDGQCTIGTTFDQNIINLCTILILNSKRCC